ncbi:MAG TPA: nuclear transport factor 2 family protein, partial [Chitinophagaceae bacterium]|nr:nuclear transport factor 2 family protein [Chitinophagaceae bacterium]
MKQYFQFRHLVILLLIAASVFIFSCSMGSKSATTNGQNDEMHNREQINVMLDSFNKAAAKADYNAYFNFYIDDAIFTGTDATERWDK